MGTGIDITIRALAEMIKGVIGFKGNIEFASSKPDGAPKKLMDNTLIQDLGWQASTELKEGLHDTYHDFLKCHHSEYAL